MPFLKFLCNVKVLKRALALLLILSLLVPILVIQTISVAPKSRSCSSSREKFIIPNRTNIGSSCTSKRNRPSLWKQVHRIPPALAQAFTNYERMHETCYLGRNLTQVILNNPDSGDSCKYLVHIEADGLGNRLLTLATAFIYSLLTNRVLLIDSRGHLSKLLCEPFNHSWILPNDFPYDLLDRAPKLGSVNDSNLGHIVRLFLMNAETGDQRFFCPETRSELAKVSWIIWTSNLYYIPRLFTFSEFWIPLTNLFPNVSLTFTYVSRYLMVPQDHVWDKITRLSSSYLSSPGLLLGLQVRLHHRDDPAAFHRPSQERILQCLHENNLLPSLDNSSKLAAKEKYIQNGERKVIKLLVTSLQVQYYEELKSFFMSNPTADGTVVEVQTFSSDGMQTDTLEQAVNAMVEIWLLSASDVFVSSSCSTFGYVAQGLAGQHPYILNIQGDDLDNCELRACSNGQSPEPCNHYPFFRECENVGKTHAHFEWEKIHIRGCQDEWEGIQLA